MHFFIGKIQTRNEDLQKNLHGAFHRSMPIYFLTPIYTAGGLGK